MWAGSATLGILRKLLSVAVVVAFAAALLVALDATLLESEHRDH